MKADREPPLVSVRKLSRLAPAAAASSSKASATVLSAAVVTPPEPTGAHWTYLTNHTHVLLLLARNPSLVLREVAVQVGITERTVQRIIADLEAADVLDREKVGRQNRYRIRGNQPLRHPIDSHITIGELLTLINDALGDDAVQ